MNENIWPIVGRPRTTHGWTIKIQIFFFFFNFMNENISTRVDHVNTWLNNKAAVSMFCNSRTLIDLKEKRKKKGLERKIEAFYFYESEYLINSR